MTKRYRSRIMEAVHETAEGMHRADIMDDIVHAKITLRYLGKPAGTAVAASSPIEETVQATT